MSSWKEKKDFDDPFTEASLFHVCSGECLVQFFINMKEKLTTNKMPVKIWNS